eukprot:5631973-Karenia_brevis.AAC.1
MVQLYCHPSWTNVADEPPGAYVQVIGSEESEMALWDAFCVPSTPLDEDQILYKEERISEWIGCSSR